VLYILHYAIFEEILDKMQVSLLNHNGDEIYLRSSPQAHEAALQQRLGLRPLPPILSYKLIKNYIWHTSVVRQMQDAIAEYQYLILK